MHRVDRKNAVPFNLKRGVYFFKKLPKFIISISFFYLFIFFSDWHGFAKMYSVSGINRPKIFQQIFKTSRFDAYFYSSRNVPRTDSSSPHSPARNAFQFGCGLWRRVWPQETWRQTKKVPHTRVPCKKEPERHKTRLASSMHPFWKVSFRHRFSALSRCGVGKTMATDVASKR